MVTPVQNKRELFVRLQDVRDQIRSHGVLKLGLFGSFARGEANRDSDADFLVQFDPRQKNFDNFMQLSFLLEDVLQRSVELVTSESISPFLSPQILTEVEDVPLSE